MDQDPDVVPTGQGTPNTPQKRGNGKPLNPKEGYLHGAPSVWRGNDGTNKNGKDRE